MMLTLPLEGFFYVMAMRILLALVPRKRTVVIGTGVVAGLFLFNKVVPGALGTYRRSCSAVENPSYAFLRGNEARLVVTDHPIISAVEINYLPSNDPNEDRYAVGVSQELSMGLFAVLDGHKGPQCSEHLKQRLLHHVMKGLADNGLVDDIKIKLFSLNASEHSHQSVQLPSSSNSPKQKKLQTFEDTIKEAFVSLDKKICDTALDAVRQIRRGRSIHVGNLRSDVLKGVAGACALLATADENTLTVASTGDCRAVVGVREKSGKWGAVAMSLDQNADNKDEVNRLIQAHPNEEKTLITMGRLLGNLMPLRAFGDVEFKWDIKDLDNFLEVPMFYHTPPYLTAEPVLTRRSFSKSDRFVVLATDGLWERMNNDQVVRTVGEMINSERTSSSFWYSKKELPKENAATQLLWKSLGGEEKTVSKLLQVPAPYSRAVRDDITIMVIHLHDSLP